MAASRRRTIGELVAESLESYGIKSAESAREIVSRARAHSRLDEADGPARRVRPVVPTTGLNSRIETARSEP